MEARLQFTLHLSGHLPGHLPGGVRPDEDAIAAENSCVAVFDGVTLLHQDPYPVPSPAAAAASRGAAAAIEYALAHLGEPDFLTGCFAAANKEIQTVNIEHGITADTVDFLRVQYAAAVGAVACFDGRILHYAQINDCGVMLCRPDGSVLDELIVDKSGIVGYVLAAREAGAFRAGSPEEHVFVRRELINSPRTHFAEYVLTGQEIAVNGVCVRRFAAREPLKVLAYSDGFIPLLHNARLRRKMLRAANAGAAGRCAASARNKHAPAGEASLAVLSIE